MCYIVCFIPHSYVVGVPSSSLQFFRLSFVRPSLILTQFSVPQMDHSNILPSGNTSTEIHLLPFIWFVHCTAIFCSLDVVRHFVFFRKLFLDFRCKLFASTPYIKCLLSSVTFVLFQSACIDLLINGSAIPARIYTSSTLLFLKVYTEKIFT